MKKQKSIWFVGLGLIIGLAVILIGSQWGARLIALPAPKFVSANGQMVGAKGPLVMEFSRPVQKASVESRVHIEPNVPGRFVWVGSTMFFYPSIAFTPGQRYNLLLDAGVEGEDNSRVAHDTKWEFAIRPLWVAYLAPAVGGIEIWRTTINGGLGEKITQTGGLVQDYAVFLNGEQIVFSVKNERAGADLWQIDRTGRDQRRLLDCGIDRCSAPEPSPDGHLIAYQRTAANKTPQVWLFDVSTGQSRALENDPLIAGELPAWSPDGTKLAFYDVRNQAIHIHWMADSRESLIQSNVASQGDWSPDGSKIIFTSEDSQSGFAIMKIFEFDLATNTIREVLSGENSSGGSDYNVPAWSPDGSWLLFGQRVLPGNPGKQLFLVHPDGKNLQSLTNDLTLTHAAYSWSPDGRAVLFQQYAFNASDNRPRIAVWQMDSNAVIVLAEDAALPEWLP